MLHLEHSAILAIIGLENQFLVFVRVTVLYRFYCTILIVKKKHAEYVPHQMTESEFWTRFFQSHYFHRDRTALANKDLFTECAKKDEEGEIIQP